MASHPFTIAIYLPNLKGGGAERVNLDLARAFLARGVGVTFVLHERTGELVDQVPRGANIVSLGVTRTLRALPRLVRYLRSNQPKILLSGLEHNNLIAILAGRIARAPTRVVVVQHCHLLHLSSREHSPLSAVPLLYRLLIRYADGIVAVSRGVAKDIAEAAGLSLDRVSVIYNPVDIAKILEHADALPHHAWLDGEQAIPVFVSVGRLVPQKDFPTLMNAFALVRKQRAARLLVLGEGPLRGALQQLAAALGVADCVDFCGFKQYPFPYMRRAAAVVLSSTFEGFGVVLVEAMACGAPVISTDCPHGPAEILLDGRLGALVPVGDRDALAEAMLATLEKRVEQSELQTRAADFSLDRIADQYVALLGSIASR